MEQNDIPNFPTATGEPVTQTRQPFSLRHLLYNLRHIAIPTFVYTIELAVWAGLNRNGLGDATWMLWRIGLLVALVIIFLTAWVFYKPDGDDFWNAATGVLLPWCILFIGSIVYGFVQMSLSFVTVNLFFWGVLVSGVMQLFYILLEAKE